MLENREPIPNRVALSQLLTFDLEDYYPPGKRSVLDIKNWLFEGIILKEKDFRASVEKHAWEQYQDAYVALICSTDAIIPGWAFMLVAAKLQPFAKKIVQGGLEELESSIYQPILENLDLSKFKDKPVIIKGCSKKPVPPNAYIVIANRLQPLVKSLMYGEACSSVPLYKRK